MALPDSFRRFAIRSRALVARVAASWRRQRWSNATLYVALPLLLFGSLLLPNWQRALIERKIRSEFPAVQRISTEELGTWLSNSRRKPPLLLDVRTAAEFDVSHIANARRVEPGASAADAKLAAARNTPIVTYCSVGYRSSAFAKRLQEAGFTNVRNLDGSIFKWANENRPLVNSHGQRTEKAHPFNTFWGRLLEPGHRAER